MSTWYELLFGSAIGLSAILVIGFMVMMAVFFIIAFVRLSKRETDDAEKQANDKLGHPS